MRRRGQLYGLLAAVAWSLAGVLQRTLSLDVLTLMAGRAAFAAAALLLWLAAARRRRAVSAFVELGAPGLLVTLCVAVASSLFIVSLHYTSVAQALLLQAGAPLIAVLLGRVILREHVAQRTWIAMGLAIAGVAVMVGGAGHGKLLGDAFALGTSIAFAVSVVLMRKYDSISMLPATALSQVLVVTIVAPLARWDTIGLHALPLLAAFGLVQMAGGLALFTIAARLVPVADLTLLLLLEVALGPLWVWLAFAQQPSATTLIGGCGVLAAVALQTRPRPGSVAALNAPP